MGVIRTAHQGTRLHMGKAPLQPLLLETGKFFGGVVPLDGQMFLGRLQVLTDRQDIHPVSRRSSIVSKISSHVSPTPTMMLDLVGMSGCISLARRRSSRDRSYLALARTR